MTTSSGANSMESTPGLTETSYLEDQDDVEEEAKLEELIKEDPLTEEQKEFNHLSKDKKLNMLNRLLEQSRVFSSIIGETLFQKAMNKDSEQDEPPRKKGRHLRGKKEKINKLDQLLEMSIPQPAILSGCEMRDYQLQGMNWLITLTQNGLNGILADEMGLGKTIQSISLLLYLYEQNVPGPFLITCPLSTCSNWFNEIRRFAPDIPVLNYVGYKDDRKKLRDEFFGDLKRNKRNKNTPVIVVTSFEIVIRDRTHLDKIDWQFLIVDEGHRLKNNNCLLIKELKKIRTANRLLLTGTPLQNNLAELWSLLNFILPNIFHDIDLFQQWFDFSKLKSLKVDDTEDETDEFINTEIEKNIVSTLHSILKPFLLRRLKKDVIKGLPPKREYIIYASLTSRQTELYKSALQKNLKEVLIRQFFKEYLKVNHYRLGTTAQIDEFIDSQLQRAKLNTKSTSEFIKYSSRYDKTRKRSTRSKSIVILDSDGEDLDLLESEEEEEDVSEFEEVKKISPKEAQALAVVKKLETLWLQVKKDLETKKLQNLMMQLRLICDSPYLFFFPWEDETKVDRSFIENSGKLIILNQILPRLIKQDHKVLIFSQFTRMLDLILDWCDFNGMKACRIDGSTDQLVRTEEINNFNEDSSYKIFLLSTRAGGLGLNLTAADTVILFDSDWNPQVDLQAMDRVHRIGQKKPVIVYRLATMNTIEQVLLSKADSKRKLEKLVISMGKFENMFSKKKLLTKTETDQFTKELGKLLLQNSIFENNKILDDIGNKLSDEELDEIFDRSPEAYQKSTEEVNENKDFKRIAIFNTSLNI